MTEDQTNITSPIDFALETIGFSVVFGILMTLFGAISLVIILSISTELFLIGLFGIVLYSIASSQHVLKRRSQWSSESEYSSRMQFIGIFLTLIHLNAVIWTTVVIVELTVTALSAEFAVLAIVAYAFWDVETRARAIPLSAGGLIVFGLVVFLLLRHYGLAILRTVTTVTRDELLDVISTTNTAASDIMEFPKRKPLDLASRRLH